MTILKQVLGIDVAKDELVLSLGRMNNDLPIEIYSTEVFPNMPKGFKVLIKWVNQFIDASIKVQFVMEETGVYNLLFPILETFIRYTNLRFLFIKTEHHLLCRLRFYTISY